MIRELGTTFNPNQRIQLSEILDSIQSQSSESKQQNVKEDLVLPMEAYNLYKINYKQNIRFDPQAENFCKYQISANYAHCIHGTLVHDI